ncbi:MAG TPA: hypothetical protein VGD80_10705 [Kofleriaceae bacterium]
MSATCHHPDEEAVLHPDCAGCARLMAQAGPAVVSSGSKPTFASRRGAELRADCADLASIRVVLSDYDEWTGGAVDAVRDALLRQAEEIVDRLVTSTIAGIAPSQAPALELRALEDAPLPGSWYGDEGADGRMLDQEQTDLLVRAELWLLHGERLETGQEDELRDILGEPRLAALSDGRMHGHLIRATRQRGGTDSDPLVRLLAFRTWGDRDRRWFEDTGVRAGEQVVYVHGLETVALAWRDERYSAAGLVVNDARAGELADVMLAQVTASGVTRMFLRVTDRPRREPEEPRWSIGAEASTLGLLVRHRAAIESAIAEGGTEHEIVPRIALRTRLTHACAAMLLDDYRAISKADAAWRSRSRQSSR